MSKALDKSSAAKTVLVGGLCCLKPSLIKKNPRTDDAVVVEKSTLGRCFVRIG